MENLIAELKAVIAKYEVPVAPEAPVVEEVKPSVEEVSAPEAPVAEIPNEEAPAA